MSHTDSVEHDSRGDGHAALYAFDRDQHDGLIGRWSLGEVGAKAAVPDPDFTDRPADSRGLADEIPFLPRREDDYALRAATH